MARIFGIVNITRDSFSDGGDFLEHGAALRHARALRAAGADVIDLGGQSTHPEAEEVPAEVEIARLKPVVERLVAEGVAVSIDTYRPAVMRALVGCGIAYINDVTALRDEEAVAVVRDADVGLVLMHNRADGARAGRAPADPGTIVDEVIAFFERRLERLDEAGIARRRIILDPGMGLFLGSNPDASVAMLRGLGRLKDAFGLPVLVGTSRKGFLGDLAAAAGDGVGGEAGRRPAGGEARRRPVGERGPATLASELFAAHAGADWIRTHDVAALRDALRVWRALVGNDGG